MSEYCKEVTVMPTNFLDLHIVDYCQLDCVHCYFEKGQTFMPLEMLRSICEDFLGVDLPPGKKHIVLSGGEPLLHPHFVDICTVVRALNGRIALSSNGILIPKYLPQFEKHDGIQISIDGNKKIHDQIRGIGSYESAVTALMLLDEAGIPHSIGFTVNQLNQKCVDDLIALCVETGTATLNCNLYQPLRRSLLQPLRYNEWQILKDYIKDLAAKNGIYVPTLCLETGCIAGVTGLSVLPDGTYWDCSRNQKVIGKYPQKISDVLYWDHIQNKKTRNQFKTCCRSVKNE